MYGKDGVYDMNDPERVSSAERDLDNIENILWPALDNMIKEYSVDDETLKKAGKTSSEWTHTDTIIYCMKELERRWNQSYDENYKELQNELKSVKSKLHDMEMEKYYLEVELKDYRKRLGEE